MISGSHDKSMFRFTRKHQMVALLLCILTNNEREFLLLPAFARLWYAHCAGFGHSNRCVVSYSGVFVLFYFAIYFLLAMLSLFRSPLLLVQIQTCRCRSSPSCLNGGKINVYKALWKVSGAIEPLCDCLLLF